MEPIWNSRGKFKLPVYLPPPSPQSGSKPEAPRTPIRAPQRSCLPPGPAAAVNPPDPQFFAGSTPLPAGTGDEDVSQTALVWPHALPYPAGTNRTPHSRPHDDANPPAPAQELSVTPHPYGPTKPAPYSPAPVDPHPPPAGPALPGCPPSGSAATPPSAGHGRHHGPTPPAAWDTAGLAEQWLPATPAAALRGRNLASPPSIPPSTGQPAPYRTPDYPPQCETLPPALVARGSVSDHR